MTNTKINTLKASHHVKNAISELKAAVENLEKVTAMMVAANPSGAEEVSAMADAANSLIAKCVGLQDQINRV